MKRGPATDFGVIRHAPTLWNEEKRIQGQKDSPLSVQGKSMATEWGKLLLDSTWDLILTSDLGRARQTAERINHSLKLPIHTEPRLREQDWGAWAGMTLAELKNKHKELLRQQERNGWDFRPPGGESRKEVLARSLSAFSDAHLLRVQKKILVVCHEGVVKCLLYHLLDRLFLPEEPQVIQGYNLHLFSFADATLSLTTMNSLNLTTRHRGTDQ